jgi:hypothetical protein
MGNGIDTSITVGRTFLSAGAGDFPVARLEPGLESPGTGRLESLPYVARGGCLLRGGVSLASGQHGSPEC